MVFGIHTQRLGAKEGTEKSEGKGVVIYCHFQMRNLKLNNIK